MTQTERITFGGTEISYDIERTSRRQTIAITVRPDATVRVAVPKGTRRKLIAERVRTRAEWIIRQLERLRINGSTRQPLYVSGETFLYLGRQYQLKVNRKGCDVSEVKLSRGCLVVDIPRPWSSARRHGAVRVSLASWYRDRALSLIEPIALLYARRLGVEFVSLDLREMKTRWGSGGPNCRLRFNWRIVMAPRRLVEYVVAHELCHIRHADHSRHFWRLLAGIMPEYEQRRLELARLGAFYDLS